MPWQVPIRINGNEYNVRFDSEPTEQDIADAVEHLKDPARGQTVTEGVVAGMEQGFQKGLAATVLTGPGAIAEAAGLEDNALLTFGREVEAGIEADSPISKENQGKFIVKAAEATGQGFSMVATAPLAGADKGFRAASMVGKARQFAFMGGLAGASAGEQEATRLGVTDPMRKSGLILGYAGVEFGSELAGGFSTELAIPGALRRLGGGGKGLPGVPSMLKAIGSEAGEEAGAGIGQRGLVNLLADEDPKRPGFALNGQPMPSPWDVGQILEDAALGAVAGGVLNSAATMLDAMTPQQKLDAQNVTGLPQKLRKAGWEALQKVTAKETVAVTTAKGVDPNAEAAMRLVFDGQRAQVLEDAAEEADTKFKPGWQEREKQALMFRTDEADTFFDGGAWKVQTGVDEAGQPVFAPAPDAQALEDMRQEFIQTGNLGEGLEALAPKTVEPGTPLAPGERRIVKTMDAEGKPVYQIEQAPAVAPSPVSGTTSGVSETPLPASATPAASSVTPAATTSPTVNPADVTETGTSSQNAPVSPAPLTETPPAAPTTSQNDDLTFYGPFKFGEMERVRSQYPHSPELVEGIASANGDAAAKAYLEMHEPRAVLREELEGMSPMDVETRMREEGVPELQIKRAYTGASVNVGSALNSIMRVRENRPAGDQAPAPKPTAPPKPRRRQMIARDVVGDILDLIEQMGGIMSATEAKRIMGQEWWEQNKDLYDDVPKLSSPLHNFIYREGGRPPDKLLIALHGNPMHGDLSPQYRNPDYDVSDLWAEIDNASKSRHQQHRTQAAQAKTQKVEETQARAFGKATQDGRRSVTTRDLAPGDVMDLEGEKVIVAGIVIEFNDSNGRARIQTTEGEKTIRIQHAEAGDLILEDGARFGRQRLPEGKVIWIEKLERAAPVEDEGEGFGRETFIPPEAFAAGVLFAPEPAPQNPTARRQPDEFEARLRRYIEENELEEWTDADIRRAVTFHETRDPDEIGDLLEPETVAEIIARVEEQMRSPAEARPVPQDAPITTGEMEDREQGNPYAEGVWQAAQEAKAPAGIVIEKTATNWTNMPEIVAGAPSALTADNRAVVVTDHVHVTLEDRQKADKSGKTAAAEALARVIDRAKKDLANRRRRDARAMKRDKPTGGTIDEGGRARYSAAPVTIEYRFNTAEAAYFAELWNNPTQRLDLLDAAPSLTFDGTTATVSSADVDALDDYLLDLYTEESRAKDKFTGPGGGITKLGISRFKAFPSTQRFSNDPRGAELLGAVAQLVRDGATANDILARLPANLQEYAAREYRAMVQAGGSIGDALISLAKFSDLRFSAARGRTVETGVKATAIEEEITAQSKILPNADTAWRGTRQQLEMHLRTQPELQRRWKDDWQEDHPGEPRTAANDAFANWLEFGLDNREGFTLYGKTYLIADQITVTENDVARASGAGITPSRMAVRRILIHEDAHEGLDHLRQIDPKVERAWREFRNAIPAAELDDLANRLYRYLKDWRENRGMHDDLAHEWWAEKIADSEDQGIPADDSLLGRFLAWLRGVWKNLMGTTVDPDTQALLDFMDAARNARFIARQQADRQGVRYSAANEDGDIPPAKIIEEVHDDPPDSAQFEPLRRPRYNMWSPARQAEYEAMHDDPNMPDHQKHYAQFLGEQTDDVRITQSLAPMIEMSNRRLGSVHGEFPDVTPENTALAYADAKAMATRKTFVRNYILEFQTWWSPRDGQGNPLHAGDAAVAVHQMTLINYALRLMAATGDSKLWIKMQPFANDVMLLDHATMSGAARGMNVRSVASRNATGIVTVMQHLHGAQHEAASKEAGGADNLDTLAKSISSPEVKAETQETFDDFVDSAGGEVIAAELEDALGSQTFETEGYRDRAVQLLDEQARAWDQQLDETLKRLDELEQIRRALEAEKAGNRARPSLADIQRYSAEMEKFRNDPAGLQKQIDAAKERAKRLLGKLVGQETSHESKEKRKKRIGDHKRAAKVLNEDAQAKKLIERYEQRRKRTKRDVPAWKELFDQQIKKPVEEADFTTKAQAAGLAPETAERLFDLADTLKAERAQQAKDRRENERQKTEDQRLDQMGQTAGKEPVTKPKGAKRLTAKSLLSAIANQILRAPLNQQRMKVIEGIDKNGDPIVKDGAGYAAPWNPQWVAEAFSNAFVEHGIPREKADEMAQKLTPHFDSIMKNAQVKAATKAAKALGVKEPKITAMGAAIRAAGLDPMHPNPIVKELAKAAGFAGLTPEDFQRMAQLDGLINSSLPTLAAKYTAEMRRIVSKVKPPKKWNRVLEQLFIDGALSSLGVMSLNWFHPAYTLPRMLVTDLAGILGDTAFKPGKSNRAETLKLVGYSFQSLWRARYGMLSDAIFSLKNDAHSHKMLELLSAEHSLYTELMANWEKLTNGTIGEQAIALPKVLWLSSDWVRRILSSADQMWGGVLENYVMENEAMRTLVQQAGMTTEAAAALVNQAYRLGAAAEEQHLNKTKDKAESRLQGRDVFRAALKAGLNAMLPGAGTTVMQTAEQTYQMELGNRRGEDSPWIDIPNFALEAIKSMSSAVRNVADKYQVPLGRAVTGFVSVASNILNRSVYLTPLGFGRVWAKTSKNRFLFNEEKQKTWYKETMANDQMIRARFYEAAASSVVIALLSILKLKWKDEDKWFAVTGNGPENAGMREAWLKQGHKPGFLEFRDGSGNPVFGIPYTRGGFDHAAMALTLVGAIDDIELDGHRARKADMNLAWAYGQKVAGNQFKQAQFFGIRAWTGAVPSSDKPHALVGQAGYLLNPWTPWGGLTKSMSKMMTGAQEQGSAYSAFLSNVPVAQLPGRMITGEWVQPRLNYLGDQIGGQPETTLKLMAERASYAGFPFYLALNPNNPNEDIYRFITERGIAPSMPARSYMESKNGFLTDATWARYITVRGDLIKEGIRRRMSALNRMEQKDAQAEIERISAAATKAAKAKLDLQ